MNNNPLPLLHDNTYERISEVCSALSHPIRLKILDLLSQRKHNWTEILDVLNIPKPNLSQHLNVLKRAKLVGANKQGLFQIYYINNSDVWNVVQDLKKIIIDSEKSINTTEELNPWT